MSTDICVVGAGAAGITLTRALAAAGRQVCLLESGGLEFDGKTQSLYEGRSVGRDYYDLDTARLRYFGGTTNHWAGVCRPLDQNVFQARDWLRNSEGWPIAFEELRPYYDRAQQICELGPFSYEETDQRVLGGGALDWEDDSIANSLLQRSPPTRFGTEYRDELRRSDSVRVYLFANAVDVEVSDSGRLITHLTVECLSGNSFSVRAREFVLAAGAVENARLLLVWGASRGGELSFRGRGLGEYFMEHMSCPAGVLLPSRSQVPLTSYQWTDVDGVPFRRILVPSDDVIRSESLLNVHATLSPTSLRSDLRAVAPGLVEAKVVFERGDWLGELGQNLARVLPDVDDVALYAYESLFLQQRDRNGYLLTVQVEQEPIRHSAVRLSDDRDRLGIPRVELDWSLSGKEEQTALRFVELLGSAAGAAGLGRVRTFLGRSDGWWEENARGAWHQMGTTRMSGSVAGGVVNPDCRVHGTANLYVAGSSVFPNSGHANPTLTIVALTLRLADHLEKKVSR